MPDLHDESDFVDTEFAKARGTDYRSTASTPTRRPPSREELEAQTQATQRRLEELKQAQTRLEQERVALEEARRRRTEYHTGREEMVQHLTRGVALLEEVDFKVRQQAEQTGRTLADLRQHLERLEALNDQVWTQETYAVELTQALTTIENARLEWNAARLQWPLLNKPAVDTAAPDGSSPSPAAAGVASLGFWRLCRLGFALTWPITLVVLLAAAAIAVALFTRFR